MGGGERYSLIVTSIIQWQVGSITQYSQRICAESSNILLVLLNQWIHNTSPYSGSLSHWTIFKISVESSDVLHHVCRPWCCHIPSLALYGSSAPVGVRVWQRAVVFPAFSLFTRQALWLRAAAEALEWNYANICSTRCWYGLNIDSVHLFILFDLCVSFPGHMIGYQCDSYMHS